MIYSYKNINLQEASKWQMVLENCWVDWLIDWSKGNYLKPG